MSNDIRDVRVDLDDEGESEVEIEFGPHHGLRITEEGEDLRFRLVSTHHGFEASAAGNDLPTQLETCIELIREEQDELSVDSF